MRKPSSTSGSRMAPLRTRTAGAPTIAQRGGWSAEGRLLWRLNDRIDRRWLRMLNPGKAEETSYPRRRGRMRD
ncbi:MAG: hypothetical protein ACT4P4_10960 [Betaproteobacteria bacterium]